MVGVRRIGRFPRFILTNLLGTAVDILVLWVLSHVVFSGYVGRYVVSPFVSFECAVLVNYLCSWHFVWSDRVKQREGGHFGRKYLYYNLSATGSFVVKMIFLLLFERIFGWNVVVCNLAALTISGLLNFAMGEWVVFKR